MRRKQVKTLLVAISGHVLQGVKIQSMIGIHSDQYTSDVGVNVVSVIATLKNTRRLNAQIQDRQREREKETETEREREPVSIVTYWAPPNT